MDPPAGNPNPPPHFNMQMLFRPPYPNPNPNPNLNPNPNIPSPYPTAAPPPHPTAFSYPPASPTFHPHHLLHYPQDPLHRPAPPNPNPGVRLMALLGTPPLPSPLESAASMPPPCSEPQPVLQASNSAPPTPQPVPARMPSSKMPRGRYLGAGDRAVYDVDARLPGESQPPQLEVTPITKYNSDPGLVLGRQIAVNRSYICYGLKMGNIRVLDINTALRELLRGHTQRVTDMAFFAEDVHLLASASVDGRVYVWKIEEGLDQENKPQICGKRVIAIQIVGDRESYHPRVCWHSHKQEILLVGIGNCVLKIDSTKVGRGKDLSAEGPLICPVEKLIDGVQLIGKHDGEVTDLSISQWMTTRLVSASKDGTIKIWEDRRTMPLATLRPHDGQPVNSVEFLTSPHRPDHIVLITAGSLNKEVKLWTSTSEEGWLLPSESESWQCTQTLELRSSAVPQVEEAFFNQVVVLPRASLVLLANAKKNAIYAVHVDYGSCPASTRMDYIADFTVAMPILSVTGTCDLLPDCQQVVQVYCVQTQAIQQYALDLSQCLPPPNDNIVLGKDSGLSRGFDTPCPEGLDVPDPSQGSTVGKSFENNASPKPTLPVINYENTSPVIYPVISSSAEVSGVHELLASDALAKSSGVDVTPASSPLPLNIEVSGKSNSSKNASNDQGLLIGDRDADQSVLDSSANRRPDTGTTSESVTPSTDGSKKVESKAVLNDISVVPNSHLMFKLGAHPAHLITPAEILSGAISSSESSLINQGDGKVHNVIIDNDLQGVEVVAKVPGENILNQHEVVDLNKQPQPLDDEFKGETFSSQTSEVRDEMVKDRDTLTKDPNVVEEACLIDGSTIGEPLEQSCSTDSISLSVAKGKKQKAKQSQAPDLSSPPLSPLNSTDSSNEPGSSLTTEVVFSHVLSMQEMLNQLVAMQTELQKQINTLVSVNITKEGKRLEAALGRSMEKAVKANVDALWARVQEENAKHEKAEKERTQQITGFITNFMSKDLPSIVERALKKEISAVGPNLARAITPSVEKAISSAIVESFQRGVGDKAVNQLEKSVNAKLEATVARQIQAQFQTSGKQVLQDALKSSLESSVIPAFEVSCRAMFDQVDTAFQKGMTEHTSAAQQQLESKHTPLAIALRDAINSASSITQNISSELADGNRKIVALLTAGNANALNPMGMQPSNGSVTGRPDMALSVQQVEAPVDPTKELARLISEHKYAEAFTSALQRSDVAMVSWLCTQVDLHGICSTVPLPLSQGVLLALLQQLACDVNNDTSKKLGWMMQVAVAINPADPMITLHVRPILEQVYNILAHLRPSSTTSATDVRAIMHVINSVLMSCK